MPPLAREKTGAEQARNNSVRPARKPGCATFVAFRRPAATSLFSPSLHVIAAMRLHLVLSGLLWPSPQVDSPNDPLPGLEALLGKGRTQLLAGKPANRWLADLFGLDGEIPFAALRRLGETPSAETERPTPGDTWLCADPVHLSFAREHLLLDELTDGELSADEAATLSAALNEHFADEAGHFDHFVMAAPTRWYLRLSAANPVPPTLAPLDEVAGRPLARFLPQGGDLAWQRRMNEAQILLHNHPINQAREAAGLRPANSVWFWGGGAHPPRLAAPLPAVQADEAFARGLARAACVEPATPDLAAALRQDTLVLIDSLHRPARRLDLEGWREALSTLERDWFAPLDAALHDGRLRELRITAPDERQTVELRTTAADRWKFWRRPRSFAALLRAFAPPPPSLPSLPLQASAQSFPHEAPPAS